MRLPSDTRFRVTPSSRATLGIGIAAALAAIVMLLWLVSARPRAAPVAVGGTPLPRSAPSTPSTPTAVHHPASAATIVVDIVGKIRRPGVYRLPVGARVQDAVQAAGGALPGATGSLNLAARLADGEQVAVGVVGAALPVGDGGDGLPSAGGSDGGTPGVTLDLNTATEQQLEALPGVGPVLAKNVLAWRAAHGGFTSVLQLDNVPGVGSAKLAQLRPLVSV